MVQDQQGANMRPPVSGACHTYSQIKNRRCFPRYSLNNFSCREPKLCHLYMDACLLQLREHLRRYAAVGYQHVYLRQLRKSHERRLAQFGAVRQQYHFIPRSHQRLLHLGLFDLGSGNAARHMNAVGCHEAAIHVKPLDRLHRDGPIVLWKLRRTVPPAVWVSISEKRSRLHGDLQIVGYTLMFFGFGNRLDKLKHRGAGIPAMTSPSCTYWAAARPIAAFLSIFSTSF